VIVCSHASHYIQPLSSLIVHGDISIYPVTLVTLEVFVASPVRVIPEDRFSGSCVITRVPGHVSSSLFKHCFLSLDVNVRLPPLAEHCHQVVTVSSRSASDRIVLYVVQREATGKFFSKLRTSV